MTSKISTARGWRGPAVAILALMLAALVVSCRGTSSFSSRDAVATPPNYPIVAPMTAERIAAADAAAKQSQWIDAQCAKKVFSPAFEALRPQPNMCPRRPANEEGAR